MGKEIIVRPHILSNRDRRVADINFGMTIHEMVDLIPDLDPRLRKLNLAVMIDGETVPRDEWGTRRIEKTDGRIEVAAVLNGGGGSSDKQVLALIATVLLMAVAPGAAAALTQLGPVAPGILAGMSASVVQAGIVLVGSLAINAIFKPPAPNTDGLNASPTYAFGGQSNQARPFGRIPRIYGQHRFVPDVIAMPYTVQAGDESFLYVIYCFGYGPVDLKEFMIGSNPLTNYSDVEMVVHESFTDPAKLEIYRQDVWQEPYSFELRKAGDGPVVVTTQEDTDRAMIDLMYPTGSGVRDPEEEHGTPIFDQMKLEYRALGSTGAWLPARIADVSKGYVVGNAVGSMSGLEEFDDNASGYSGETRIRYRFPFGTLFTVSNVTWGPDGQPAPGTKIEFYGGTGTILGATYGSLLLGQGAPGIFTVQSTTVNSVTFTTDVTHLVFPTETISFRYESPTNPANGTWAIGGFFGIGFNASATMLFPTKGEWSVRITKLNDDKLESEIEWMWRRYVTALKSFKNVPPLNPPVPITIVELKIKATGQLNGNIQQFSAIATSKLRKWQAGSWQVLPTRNPAWIYLDILTGTANMRPLADSRIDIDRLKSWAIRNDTIDAGFTEVLGTCDIVIDREYTMWQVLQSVAGTGRAAPGMRDNLYSVIIDDSTRTAVQLFTPRNSSNLQSRRTYLKEPHALRVKWVDPFVDYGPAEIIIYNTGYNAENATEFEELQSFGMTRPEQVTRWGRYMMAQGKLRQERFTLEVDIEHIVCLRGDLVLVAHDTIQIGGEGSRIIDIVGAKVSLDAPPSLDTALLPANAGLRVRRRTGVFSEVMNIVAIGNDGEFDYVTVADATKLTGVFAGDLVVFGPKTTLTGEYVVDFIRPNGDLGATIGLEEYAPAVYTAESTGVIPPYTPPGGGKALTPPVASFTANLIEFYRDIRPMGKVKLRWRPDPSVPYTPETYRVMEVFDGGAEELAANVTGASYETGAFNLLKVAGQTKIYRVRADYGARGLSPWKTVSLTFPVRTSLPPAEVAFFDVTDLSTERRRYTWTWGGTGVQPKSVVGVEIRYVAGNILTPDWATMTKLVPNAAFIAQSGLELNRPIGAGTFTFVCRAVDELGVLSPVGYRVVSALAVVAPSNDTAAPPTPTGFTALGGFNSVRFGQTAPSFTMGRGYSYTQVYAAIYSGTGPLPVFADATPFAGFTDTVAIVGAPPAVQYRFWAKWVSKDGGISASPAGGTNGVSATTAVDVAATLTALAGQLTATQLHTSLGSRIDLIDAPSGTAGSVNARVLSEQTARISADSAMATSITTLQAKGITSPNLVPNGGFEQGGDNWTFTANAVGGNYTLAGWGPCYTKSAPAGSGNITSSMFSVSAGANYSAAADYRLNIAAGAVVSCGLQLRWFDNTDTLISASAGPLVTANRNLFSADDTGRDALAFTDVAPVGAVNVQVRFVWTLTSGTINAVGVRQVKVERGAVATRYSLEVALQMAATVVDGLEAQYTVKIDNNGYVTGFGLASTLVNGTPTSTFAVRSDAFYIASPSGPGVAPSMPFIVYTTPTVVNGTTVPAGVYMSSAFIHDALITNAMINSLNANKIVATSLSSISANIGLVTAGVIRNSDNSARIDMDATGAQVALRWGTLTDYGTQAGGNHYPVEVKANGSAFFARVALGGGEPVASGTGAGSYTIPAIERPAVYWHTPATPSIGDSGGD